MDQVSANFAVAVIGGGAAGILACAHLRRAMPGVALALIAAGPAGGLAYGRAEEGHLLNVPAALMSAFPEAPGDFVAFSRAAPGAFVPRLVFRAYLRSVADTARATAIDGQAVACAPEGAGWRVTLADGRAVCAAAVILATGNPAPAVPRALAALSGHASLAADPWAADRFDGLEPDDAVLLVGTGLTMVDQVVSLRARGHTGTITAMSRRGQTPQAHLAHPDAPWTPPASLPGTISGLTRLLRAEAAKHPWRSVVDGLRPHTILLWQALPDAERARFLRHARAFWDVRRSRIAPEVAAALSGARDEGRLRTWRGRVLAAVPDNGRAQVTIGAPEGVRELTVAKVIVCTGPGRQTATGILRSLCEAGLAREDACGLGLDTTPDGNLRDAGGGVATSLFALGPPLRGVLWESIAVPDVSRQADALAVHVASGLRARGVV